MSFGFGLGFPRSAVSGGGTPEFNGTGNLLQEDGAALLQENGSYIIVTRPFFLTQESTAALLQENGSNIYV